MTLYYNGTIKKRLSIVRYYFIRIKCKMGCRFIAHIPSCVIFIYKVLFNELIFDSKPLIKDAFHLQLNFRCYPLLYLFIYV